MENIGPQESKYKSSRKLNQIEKKMTETTYISKYISTFLRCPHSAEGWGVNGKYTD